MKKCEKCGKKIDIDKGKPAYITVTGWQGDYQYAMDVCIECFTDKPLEILGKLCKGRYE